MDGIIKFEIQKTVSLYTTNMQHQKYNEIDFFFGFIFQEKESASTKLEFT